ncbi:MAG: class I SAM-dependent methyltransferase [Phycisphaeraceae bacterium]|nr:class I SAM-dependent methyltransferase [Phycisphaeraceae bacterium]
MLNVVAEKQCIDFTDRQQREAAYYDQYSTTHEVQKVDFAPATSDQLRPWSPYWSLVRLVRDEFRDSSQKLLEFGSGMGVTSTVFAKVGFNVTGIDISEGNCRVARKLVAQYGLEDRCDFQVMPGEMLEFDDNTFDVITGVDILHHVDVPVVIKELKRVLKPGGVAIFKEPLGDTILERIRELKLFMKMAPRDSSQDNHIHITEDERKLSREEIDLIYASFTVETERRFSVLQRFYRLLPKRWWNMVWKLQRADYEIMSRCKTYEKLGDIGIFVCRKTA